MADMQATLTARLPGAPQLSVEFTAVKGAPTRSLQNGCVSVISVGCLYAVVQIFVEHSVGHATLAPLVEDNPHVIAALLYRMRQAQHTAVPDLRKHISDAVASN